MWPRLHKYDLIPLICAALIVLASYQWAFTLRGEVVESCERGNALRESQLEIALHHPNVSQAQRAELAPVDCDAAVQRPWPVEYFDGD